MNPDIIRVVKVCRLGWAGHIIRTAPDKWEDPGYNG